MKNDIKVLTIGNSFTDSLKQFFQTVTESAGCTLSIGYANHGGCELHRHWEYVFNEERDGEYNMYAGKKLRDHLTSEKWDYVTIQQASRHSWQPETFQPYADNLIGYIRKFAPSAEILIQQTWAYRSDSPRLIEWNISQEDMYERLTMVYAELARHAGLRMIPTGYAVQLWRRSQKIRPFFSAEEKLKSYCWPDLPPMSHELVGAVYWMKDKNTGELFIARDTIHLNEQGRYLQACVWFGFLTGHAVADIKFVPDCLGNQDAAFIRKIAQQAIDEFPQVGKCV